jgi:hypothetical protein
LDENARVGGETGERHRNVIVQAADLAHSAVVLEHSNGLLLNTKHDNVLASDSDLLFINLKV